MTKDKKIVVFGIFDSRAEVESGVDNLKAQNFRNSDISVLMPDARSSQNFAHEKETKAPEGSAAGAGAGVVLGGALGWLVGIGALAVPGLGPFIAAGPIMAMLAGAGVGGTVGALSGALIGLGIPEYEAKRYEGIVKKGGILISVHCDDNEWKRKAMRVLEQSAARDVSSSSEVRETSTVREVPRRPDVITPTI